MTLTSCQDSAASKFAAFLFDDSEKEFLLTGPAGSGKTFLLNQLIVEARRQFKFQETLDERMQEKEIIIDLTATTNKAADVISQAFPDIPAGTIHSFLGIAPKWDANKKDFVLKFAKGKTKGFRFKASKQQKHIIVIDEASMMNTELYKFIQKWLIVSNSKVLYVADSYQLPPVGECISPVFLQQMPTAELSEVVRQTSDSNLAQVVRSFRDGVANHGKVLPALPDSSVDVQYYDNNNPESWFQAIKDSFPSAKIGDARILCYTNNRVKEYINWFCREWGKEERPQEGDVVINNFAVMNSAGDLLCPGDTLVVIDKMRHTQDYGVDGIRYTCKPLEGRAWLANSFSMFVPNDFSDKKAKKSEYARDKNWANYLIIEQTWGDLRFPQVMTVHKSQGSTFKEVFIDVTNFQRCRNNEDYRRLLYVAASRASEKLHLLGTPR